MRNKSKNSTRKRLLPQLEVFCLEYIKLNEGKAAAIAAGYAPKYADRTASRILTRPATIERLKQLRQKAEDASIATVIERKQVLTEVIRGRVSQFTDGNRISVNAGDLNTAAVAEVTTSEIKFGRGDDALTAEITKLKLRDPIAAISELNKMDGIYKPDGAQINIDNRTLNIIVRNQESAALIGKISERPQLNGD